MISGEEHDPPSQATIGHKKEAKVALWIYGKLFGNIRVHCVEVVVMGFSYLVTKSLVVKIASQSFDN